MWLLGHSEKNLIRAAFSYLKGPVDIMYFNRIALGNYAVVPSAAAACPSRFGSGLLSVSPFLLAASSFPFALFGASPENGTAFCYGDFASRLSAKCRVQICNAQAHTFYTRCSVL